MKPLKHQHHSAARILITAVLLAGSVTLSMSQTKQKPDDRTSTSISGRVVNESGQPIPNAAVVLAGTGIRVRERRNVTTDQDGRFLAEDLPRGLYHLGVYAHGYVFTGNPREPVYYKPGDSATLEVRKGGVITGTVTNSAGEPVIGIRVVAVPYRDQQGRPSRDYAVTPVYIPGYTDDRGVYRLFGLPAGYHLVAAGGKFPGFTMGTAFDDATRTFYPSSTRDTAVEVPVGYGTESTGINIRYRGDRGYIVSGFIGGGSLDSRMPTAVQLVMASTGAVEASTNAQVRGAEYSFAFYGVSAGDYYINAGRFFYQNDDGARSRPVAVKVRDREVTGIQITLEPLSSLAGRVVLEAPSDKSVRCEQSLQSSIEETMLTVRHDQKEESTIPTFSNLGTSARTAPGDNGEFLLQGLEAGHYRLEPRVLDEALYIRSITVAAAARGATEVDAGRRGFALKAGQRVNGATIMLAEGAASLRGRVVADKQNDPLPDRLRAHLVPAEQEAADDVLRFAEAAVQNDGSFPITNLAPGRYWLFVRQASKEQSGERSPRPIHWETSSRASLRRDAAASNISIDLKPCQRMSDFKLRYAPSTELPAKSVSH